mgnify:CR=1 FL=1
MKKIILSAIFSLSLFSQEQTIQIFKPISSTCPQSWLDDVKTEVSNVQIVSLLDVKNLKREVGIPKEKLYFAIVDIKGQKDSHMILLYLETKESTPLVLDNLSSMVIPLTRRTKLIPKFAFNEIDSYKFTHEKFTEKVKINWGKENKWEKLLFRVYTLNE